SLLSTAIPHRCLPLQRMNVQRLISPARWDSNNVLFFHLVLMASQGIEYTVKIEVQQNSPCSRV
ncbi:hypothetical protein, partial [Phascolarctobacterium sp.]|uniref:hypothetical protein n=1 Tax=Phascolarctobacterium sp. TaxID=2049039 RepID=UPI00386811F0